MSNRFRLSLILGCALAACGAPDKGGGPDARPPQPDDADGDGISDQDEGREAGTNTDGDDLPDWQDDDSDGDGIPDYREAGDEDLFTNPVDSDGDSVPDFQDTDSDANGRVDGVDGTDDLDGDGKGNFADLDDDGDGMNDEYELGDDPANPIDSDGDDAPDFQDTDSDNDTILDEHERVADPDADGVPAFLDLDSDGDCIPDAVEAGDADLQSFPPDTDLDGKANPVDIDSDNDGLADGDEDANCNGIQEGGESSGTDADSDDDGVSDLVEDVAGTDPLDPSDNPQANGDFVFVVPYEGPPDPDNDDLDFSTDLKIVDVYMLVDRSGSMSGEIGSVRNNIATALGNVTCPPLGNGDPNNCIADLWSGTGSVGYSGTNGQSYTNHLDLQPNPALTGPALPTSEPGGCCAEPLHLATWSTATGQGSVASGCSISTNYSGRASCNNSPAGPNGIGFPCFRPNALPIILLTTDEAPTQTYNCPTQPLTISAANNAGAKIVGILGSDYNAQVVTDLNALATGTGAVDQNNNNAPLVFQGANANAATAIENAIRTLANGIPLDISATPVDDGSDSVDAVADFVDHLQTLQLGTPECANGLTDQDTNSDGFADLYIDVLPGTPVCWRLVPKMNTTVMSTTEPQLFRATIEVYGDATTLLDTRDVYFLVPPEIEDVPIN